MAPWKIDESSSAKSIALTKMLVVVTALGAGFFYWKSIRYLPDLNRGSSPLGLLSGLIACAVFAGYCFLRPLQKIIPRFLFLCLVSACLLALISLVIWHIPQEQIGYKKRRIAMQPVLATATITDVNVIQIGRSPSIEAGQTRMVVTYRYVAQGDTWYGKFGLEDAPSNREKYLVGGLISVRYAADAPGLSEKK